MMLTSAELYLGLRASLFRYLDRKRTQFASAGFPVTLINFDAFNQTVQLPAMDIIGPFEVQVELNPLVVLDFSIGVSTLNDPNLDRMSEFMSELVGDFIPGTGWIPMIHPRTGAEVGRLTAMEGTTVLPVASTTMTRPVQFLGVRLGADASFPASPGPG
jgi:hypothetical protein